MYREILTFTQQGMRWSPIMTTPYPHILKTKVMVNGNLQIYWCVPVLEVTLIVNTFLYFYKREAYLILTLNSIKLHGLIICQPFHWNFGAHWMIDSQTVN